jgi:hypothetical protein
VWNALEVARQALEKPSCRKYVGEGAYQALRKMWDERRITFFNGLAFDKRGEAWAETIKLPFGSPRMVLSYHFFSDASVDAEAAHYGITRIQDRAETLLHEARHALCAGCNYAEDHVKSWDDDIVKNCFK